MASTATPVLSLSTIVEYPTVEIDGTRYKLTPADAMTLRARMELEKTEQRIIDLLNTTKNTDADDKEITALLDQNCRQVLQAPDEVHAKLKDPLRILIVQAFMILPRAQRRPPVEAGTLTAAAATPGNGHASTGASSSRGSRTSTAAARRPGSTKPRSASSARVPK